MATTLTQPEFSARTKRLTLDDLDISIGKKTRLHRLLYDHGPGNGKMIVLPIDQGLEHGPMDFFGNPASADPDYQYQLAVDGGYSGIALHIGLAEKYMKQYAGRIPLVLKINGKTCVPSDDNAFSPLTSSVEDAVRLGADAIGYTIYVGTPAQDRDIQQFNTVRKEAERYGMPIIVWAYPRGTAMDKKGGKESFYAIDYAARVACELGADVVKINFPLQVEAAAAPAPYNTLRLSKQEMANHVVKSAGKTLVIFSGGSKISDAEVEEHTHIAMNAGAVGLIFGRNMWQRPMDEALALTGKLKSIMSQAN